MSAPSDDRVIAAAESAPRRFLVAAQFDDQPAYLLLYDADGGCEWPRGRSVCHSTGGGPVVVAHGTVSVHILEDVFI